ncbi:hypothetical protein, partial [Senegalia massiliensis]|uniref:hypothetical protein n=1 Tax=Senegalia massiliensis TaxID=1720316 RepID=UPI001A9B8B07
KEFFILCRIINLNIVIILPGGFNMEEAINDLVQLSKDFIKFAEKLYKDEKIDKETYIEITKRKKGFLRFVEKDKIYK